MEGYNFYYDESEHSRVINSKSITADNFYDGFVVAIVGWPKATESEIKRRYSDFELCYSSPDQAELKSTAIKPSQLRYGFNSLNKKNLSLIDDFLGLLNEGILIFSSYSSKLEFLIGQVVDRCENFNFLNHDLVKYSIVKSLIQYRPREVLDALYEDPETIVSSLCLFLTERIAKDRENESLKRREIECFSIIVNTLRSATPPKTLRWDYAMPLKEFSDYLKMQGIENCHLVIDNEEATALAARDLGFTSVCEMDSRRCFGVRMADMLAGITAKLMKALHNDLQYISDAESCQKRLLSEQWFCINDKRLSLYKAMRAVLRRNDVAALGVHGGIYRDDYILLMALLEYFGQFESADDLRQYKGCHGECFNASACKAIEEHFNGILQYGGLTGDEKPEGLRFGANAPTLDVLNAEALPPLPVTDRPRLINVISVGIDGAFDAPVIYVQCEDGVFPYRLPVELTNWARQLSAYSGKGISLFPSPAIFQLENGICRVDIL